jgi:hypothetical protein
MSYDDELKALLDGPNQPPRGGPQSIPRTPDGQLGYGPVPFAPVPSALNLEVLPTPDGPMICITVYGPNGMLCGMFTEGGLTLINEQITELLLTLKTGLIIPK